MTMPRYSGRVMKRARTPGRAALIGWAAVASVIIGAVVILVAQATTPADASAREAVVPTDIVGHLIGACIELIPGEGQGTSFLYNFEITPEGEAIGSVGEVESVNDDGSISTMIDDEALTAVVNECFASYGRVETRDDWHLPTRGERLLIYDWTLRWEAPCLQAHGIEFGLPPYASFVEDEQGFPSYILANTGADAGTDFSTILAARIDCEPIPPFLRKAGVGP